MSALLQSLTRGVAVTPSDSVELPFETRAVWIGGAGNLAVTMEYGENVVLSGVQAGTLLPIKVTKVRATSTTATLIAALR